MERRFKKGEVVFHCDCFNFDLSGFAEVLQDETTNGGDEIVLIDGYSFGESEAYADRVYQIADNLICTRCGCIVLHEHSVENDYPYYCPYCDENKYRIEVTHYDDERANYHLCESISRFSYDDEF